MIKVFDKLNESPLDECIYQFALEIRNDFPIEQVKQQINQLAEEASGIIAPQASDEQRLEQLLDLFYNQWHFRCSEGIYSISEALWPDKVLEQRRGVPAGLGFILLTLALRLNITLSPVLFPTQLLLQADWLSQGNWGINPQNGEKLSLNQLAIWVKGYLGAGVRLNKEMLAQADNETFLYKMMTAIKNAYMNEERLEYALKVSELIVKLNPGNPYEIRDRGLIYAQLQCEHIALSDLNYFIEQCPEDPVAELVKMQINSISHREIVLH